MKRLVLLGIAAAGAFMGFLIWRDARQAKQMEELSARVASLSSARVQPAGPGQVVLNYPGPAPASSMDPADIDRIAARVAGMMKGDAGPKDGDEAAQHEAARSAGIDHAERVLDGAIARGKLSRDDVLEMRKGLAQGATQEEADALARRVAVAINTGKVIPEDPRYMLP